MFGVSLCRGRIVGRECVHRAEGVEIAAGLRCVGSGRVLDDLKGPGRGAQRPQQVAGPQEGEAAPFGIGQGLGIDGAEDFVGVVAAAQPRQGVCPNEIRLWPRPGLSGGGCQSLGEVQVCQPRRAVRCPHQQLAVGRQVGVQAQRRPPDHDPDVVAVVGRGQLGGDQTAQSPQPGRWGAPSPHLAVERVGHPHLHTACRGFEGDQAAGFRVFDCRRAGNPLQRSQSDRLADRQGVDHIADRRRQGTDAGLDQLDEARWHDRIAVPLPEPVLPDQPAIGDLPLDDVAQIEGVALGQGPQPAGGMGIDQPAERHGQQGGRLVQRQRLDVEAGELAGFQHLLQRGRTRLVADGEKDFRRAALDHLMHDEDRQFVEQLHVVDTQQHGPRRRRGECVDHPAHQLDGVGHAGRGPRGEGAQRDGLGGRGAHDPTGFVPVGFGRRQRLAGDAALAHTCCPAQENPGDLRRRQRGSDDAHLLRATG